MAAQLKRKPVRLIAAVRTGDRLGGLVTMLRRVRAAFVNATFWGVAWFFFGLALHVILRLVSGSPLYLSSSAIQALVMAAFGFFLGGAFSLYLAGVFRHQHIDRINPARFAAGGALVTVLAVLGVGYFLNVEQVTDEVLAQPLELYRTILQSMLIAAGVGGATAWGTIKLAQLRGDVDQPAIGHDVLAAQFGSPVVDTLVVEQSNKR